MEARLDFRGTGGELFKRSIGGALLTGITFGIYGPWFQVGLTKYITESTRIRGTKKGDLELEFTGSGAELFKIGFVGALLTGVTFGIYAPWLIVKLIHFHERHTRAKAPDGTLYSLSTRVTGGELFKELLVGALLTGLTLGIYAPWFLVKFQAFMASRTEILEGGRTLGRIAFRGRGTDLFVMMFVGQILTMLTAGIYLAWLQVKVLRYTAQNTEISIAGHRYTGDFLGQGKELFVLNLVGMLLTGLTLGVYGFWYLARSIAFQTQNTIYRRHETAASYPSEAEFVPTSPGAPRPQASLP